jgi:hypothetical protein
LNHHKYIFAFIIFLSFIAQSETLKNLAHKSTALLFLADNSEAQKKCGLSAQKISMLSQQLKFKVDSKIENLTSKDFEILNHRMNTCALDCSCSIYALAYEARGKDKLFNGDKASPETAADRQKCVSKIKNICAFAK